MQILITLLLYIPLTFASDTLIIKIGESHTLQMNRKDKVYIQNRIISAKKTNNQLKVLGLKAGQTQISYGEKTLNLFVLKPDEYNKLEGFNLLFKDHPNLKLLPLIDGLTLTGEILSVEDLKKLMEWKKNFSSEILWHVSFPAFLRVELKEYLSSYFDFNIELSENEFQPLILNSNPPKETQQKLTSLGFDFHISEISKAIGYLKLYFAEIKKSKLEQLSPILMNSHSLQNLSVNSLLNPLYSHLDDRMFSSIGSQSQILIFPNQNSKIHSGGEFPILNQNFHRSDLSWKQFGLFIDVLGQELGNQAVALDLNFKLSMLAGTNQDGIPNLTTDSWQQKIRVQKNTTYILKSGFTKHHLHNHNRSFIFKHIPLLNFLFQGQSQNKNDTEIVLALSLKDNL